MHTATDYDRRVFPAARALAGTSLKAIGAASGIGYAGARKVEAREADEDSDTAFIKALEGSEVFVNLAERMVSATINPDDPVQLGRLLAAGRVGAGLSQKDLADASGASLRSVGNAESGEVKATAAVRKSISTAISRRGVEILPAGQGTYAVRIGSREDGVPGGRGFPEGESAFDMISERLRMSSESIETPMMRRLRITVDGTEPSVWRELLVPVNTTFADLHSAIQTAFGWKFAHTHEFDCGMKIGPIDANDGPISSPQVLDDRLFTLDQATDRTFHYTYDFGDGWQHTIQVGLDEPRGKRMARPHVMDGEGACPVEDVGGFERWNEFAAAAREGRLTEQDRNWLERCGYGADMDPTAFDLKAADAAVKSCDFRIPTTWLKEWERRKAIAAGSYTLPEGYPFPKDEPLPLKGLRVVSSGPFGEKGYEKRGWPDKASGTSLTISKRLGRHVTVRYHLSSLVRFLDFASDVKGFETIPTAYEWTDGKRSGYFVTDFGITWEDGTKVEIAVVSSEEEAKFAMALWDAGLGNVMVVTDAFLDHPALNLSEELWRHHGGRIESDPQTKVVLEAAGLEKGMSMKKAIKALVDAKMPRLEGWEGGRPEYHARYRIAAAISQGEIGADFGKDFENGKVGPKSLTSRTAALIHAISRFVIA